MNAENSCNTYYLKAGTVHLKYADGELRYIYAGGKEIIRRIYFAVRDSRWDTVMPVITNFSIEQTECDFHISFDADCKNDIAHYSWHGEIHGDAAGQIMFKADGHAQSSFQSPRVGLNILYGTDSLAGQKYTLTNELQEETSGVFPTLVADPLLAEYNSFQTLSYTTADKMTVSAGLDTQCIGMEDQRTFGDSSYKAFSCMDYEYPNIDANVSKSQILTLKVENPPPPPAIPDVIGVKIEGAIINSMAPVITDSSKKITMSFQTCNHSPDEYANAEEIVLTYNPALHMPDDDTFMENITTVVDWVKTIRSFAPNARIIFDPITFNSPYPRAADDKRNDECFAAAWCMRMIKNLALAGADEAVFTPCRGYAASALERVAPFVRRPILQTELSYGEPVPIDALATADDEGIVVWLINMTSNIQNVSLEGVGKILRRYSSNDDSSTRMELNPSMIMLSPYEVLECVLQNYGEAKDL